MTLEELKELCESAIAEQEGIGLTPIIQLIIPRIAYGRRTKIAPGLWGLNLGHYPHYKKGTWDVEFWGTMVRLDVADVQKWIEKVEAEIER